MNLSEEKDPAEVLARSPYDIFKFITNSPFFLAMTGPRANQLRKQTLPQLKPAAFIQTAEAYHEQFNARLFQGDCGIQHITSVTKWYVQTIFMSQLLGIPEIPTGVRNLLNEIEGFIEDEVHYSLLPKLLYISPSAWKQRRQFQQVCDQLSKLAAYNGSFNEPENRLLLGFLFAASNLSKTLRTALSRILNNKYIYDALLRDIHSGSPEMPYLHAFFLEAMRKTAAASVILRYTVSGIQTAGLNIPPHSLIFFSIHGILNNDSYFPEPGSFLPDRFLGNNNHSLHHGAFLPFGNGSRICPAASLSEKLFKSIIMNTVKSLEQTLFSVIDSPLALYSAWRKGSENDSYDTYFFDAEKQKQENKPCVQLVLNADLTTVMENIWVFNSQIQYVILYRVLVNSLFPLIPYRIDLVKLEENCKKIIELKESYETASPEDKENIVDSMSPCWNSLVDEQLIIHCGLEESKQVESELVEMAAEKLIGISNGIQRDGYAAYDAPHDKRHRLNSYFSCVRTGYPRHQAFFKSVETRLQPQQWQTVPYPQLGIDNDRSLSGPVRI